MVKIDLKTSENNCNWKNTLDTYLLSLRSTAIDLLKFPPIDGIFLGSYGPWNTWNILEKKLILNNPEMSFISKQYSANPWNVLEFNKSKI
jgi:hypothetical protein